MRLVDIIPKIAQALISLCDENGPQKFSCWEVSERGGGASNMRIGRVARQHLAAIKQQLAGSDYQLANYDGRFHMEKRA